MTNARAHTQTISSFLSAPSSSPSPHQIALRDVRWGDVATFLLDSTGDTLVHPLLAPVRELLSGPVFPDIEKLEMYNNQPREFNSVRRAMLRGEHGSATMVRKRGVPHGGRDSGLSFIDVRSTYYYGICY